jgi:hypothetical protein
MFISKVIVISSIGVLAVMGDPGQWRRPQPGDGKFAGIYMLMSSCPTY